MLKESIDFLSINPEGNYADVTFGGGGHSREILNKISGGKLLAFDQDNDALENKWKDNNLILVKSNFKYLKQFLSYYDMLPLDGLLADLGVSSYQIDDGGRGFSFRNDGALDMRMNQNANLSAWQVVNNYSVDDLAKVFKRYGEINNAYALARRIILERNIAPINTTGELKNLAENYAIQKNRVNKYLSQVFQAIRIEVNQEITSLESLLTQLPGVMKEGGRMVVISYHSLEDRLVKNFVQTGNLDGVQVKDDFGVQRRPFVPNPKKIVLASESEIRKNPRSRSAKLRVAIKNKI